MLRQLTRFPLGTLDDKVDVCGLFARMINKVWEQSPPEPKQEPVIIKDNALRIEDFAPKAKQEEW